MLRLLKSLINHSQLAWFVSAASLMQERAAEAGTVHLPTCVSLWRACTCSSLFFWHFSPAPIASWTHWHHKVCRIKSLCLCLWCVKTPGSHHDPAWVKWAVLDTVPESRVHGGEKGLVFTCLTAASLKQVRTLGEHWCCMSATQQVCSCFQHKSRVVTVCPLSPTAAGHHGWKLLLFSKEEQFGYSAVGNKMFMVFCLKGVDRGTLSAAFPFLYSSFFTFFPFSA